MSDEPVVLINQFRVDPEKQEALIVSLKQNTKTVIRTLVGWKSTRIMAAMDGSGVIIYSEWESASAVEAMRDDARMKTYFPKVIELASLESVLGHMVLSESK